MAVAQTKTVVKNGIPIVHKTKVLSMSPSRTLMTLEQDLIDQHGAQRIRNQQL